MSKSSSSSSSSSSSKEGYLTSELWGDIGERKKHDNLIIEKAKVS